MNSKFQAHIHSYKEFEFFLIVLSKVLLIDLVYGEVKSCLSSLRNKESF